MKAAKQSAIVNITFHQSGVGSSTMPQTFSVIQWNERPFKTSEGRGSSAGRTFARISRFAVLSSEAWAMDNFKLKQLRIEISDRSYGLGLPTLWHGLHAIPRDQPSQDDCLA